jgi:hypothetical protein
MKHSFSARTWTWLGAVALVLTVGFIARRPAVPAGGDGEQLRDAVASPAPVPGALTMARPGSVAFEPPPSKRTLMARRLHRLADAFDAKAASLRAASR